MCGNYGKLLGPSEIEILEKRCNELGIDPMIVSREALLDLSRTLGVAVDNLDNELKVELSCDSEAIDGKEAQS